MELTEIDLSKGDRHEHPDIKTDRKTLYLVKHGNSWILGSFHRQRYGLCFTWFWGMSSLQYDKPGTNHSSWKKVYETDLK